MYTKRHQIAFKRCHGVKNQSEFYGYGEGSWLGRCGIQTRSRGMWSWGISRRLVNWSRMYHGRYDPQFTSLSHVSLENHRDRPGQLISMFPSQYHMNPPPHQGGRLVYTFSRFYCRPLPCKSPPTQLVTRSRCDSSGPALVRSMPTHVYDWHAT